MGKLSALGIETAFGDTDFFIKVKAAGGGDVLVSAANVRAALGITSRRAPFTKTADGSGGATISQQEANEIHFTGTPSGFGRLDLLLPMDYVSGTNATINLVLYSDSTNNQAINYYVGSHASGSSYSTWNIQNNITTGGTIGLTANTISTFALYTIGSSNLAAGNNITLAFKPSGAITGNIYVTQAYLAYTARI